MLPNGATINCINLSSPLEVIRLLGSGGQGEVYEVRFGNEVLAAKWYYPKIAQRDSGLANRLRSSIRSASPCHAFLWPISLIEPSQQSCEQFRIPSGTFGYLMGIRPSDYVGAIEHSNANISISLRNIVRACLKLADAFNHLHSKGLCYKDISLGNIFLNPTSGDILICDNDNVEEIGYNEGLALGTPGFMAPEVLRGEVKPSVDSDLFSMAVLMFHLLTRSDPLKGKLELAIRCLDEPARRRLYGEDPVFIFDPNDDRNRPDPEVHLAATVTWPIYPDRIKQLFQQTFGVGLSNPSARVQTGQWCEALCRCLDNRLICPHCGQEVFLDDGASQHCWACNGALQKPACFKIGKASILAQADNEIHPHHFDSWSAESIETPIARVESHPSNPAVLGLHNLSDHAWKIHLLNGESLELPSGRRCNLEHLATVHTHLGTAEIIR